MCVSELGFALDDESPSSPCIYALSLSHSEIDSYCRHHLTEWEKRGLGITHAQNPSKKELLFLASARVTMCVCVSTKRQHHAGRCDDDDEDAEKEEGGSHPKKMSFPPARCTHTGLLPRISSCCRFPSSSSSISNSTVRHQQLIRRLYASSSSFLGKSAVKTHNGSLQLHLPFITPAKTNVKKPADHQPAQAVKYKDWRFQFVCDAV